MDTQPDLVQLLNAAFREKDASMDVAFRSCTIDLAVINPLAGNAGLARTIDLSAFNLLKVENDFLPASLYVRDCMRDVFQLFRADNEVTCFNNHRRVLLGSPGVGKSVLFFMAALQKAHDSSVPVLYLRKKREEELLSMFVMRKIGVGQVSVVFCRDLPKSNMSIPVLYFIFRSVLRKIGGAFTRWIDGPRHDNEDDTLQNSYDYLCTSGGHPPPKNGEMDKYIWLLDAWRKEETIAFARATGNTHYIENVERVYWLCGGSMRSMLKAFVDFEFVMSDITISVNSITKGDVKLFLFSNDRTEGKMDSLRSMFMSPLQYSAKRAIGMQLVDSDFVLSQLSLKLDVGALLEAYDFAVKLRDGIVAGQYFEKVLHRSIEINHPGQVIRTIRSTGTGLEGVNELNEVNAHWIPRIPSFADIDSAVVVGETLHVIQATIEQTHSFDVGRFWDSFAQIVRSKLSFDAIIIHFFVPARINFRTVINATCQYNRKRTRSEGGLTQILISSNVVHVNLTNIDSVARSIAESSCFT